MGLSTVDRVKTAFFRRRRDGSGTIRLDRHRIYILPTGAGLLYALTLFTMLLGAINYSLTLGHLLVFLLAALGLNAMLHTFRNLYGLSLTPAPCAPVFVGESVHFPLRLAAAPGVAHRALEFLPAGGSPVRHAQCVDSDWIALPVPAKQRGWLSLPRIKLASRYPLGLFVAWSWLQPEVRALVYPAPCVTPLPVPLPAAGELASGQEGREDFAGFRDRQPADSPRHVAWKASSRQSAERPLLVKQFAGGARPEYRLDWLACSSGDPEARLSQLCGWILAVDAAGSRYSLSLPDCEIAAAHGPAHRQRCLEALALFPAPNG
ncbi:DUF58 domain-containing protein [Dechloromonas sp. ZY10]|uniref:DUF58 domain-containing protein n=1 Tax=Dechloromonas aquae TaxID=2664436 RepID=UPI003528F226